MTACATWREELIDHALGRPAGAALSAHVATCAACAAALADRRAQADRLDAGVRALVVRDPSPSLISRVLARVDTGPARAARSWHTRAALAGAALVAGAFAITVAYNLGGPKNDGARPTAIASAATSLAHWRAPTDVLLHIR